MGHYERLRQLEDQRIRIARCQEEVDELRRKIKELQPIQQEIDANIEATKTILVRTGYLR